MGFTYDLTKAKLLNPVAISETDPTQVASGTIVRWLADDIKAVLVDTALYTAVQATDEFLSDIAVGARVATSPNLTTKTVVGGTVNSDDPVFTAVSGATVEVVVVYKDTGTAATSPLIAYLDASDITGLPITPNGGDITLAWDDGTGSFDGIFRLLD